MSPRSSSYRPPSLSSSEISFGMASPSDSSIGGLMVVAEGLMARVVALKAFTNYSVAVSAATSVGVGVPSEGVVCSTLQDGE